MNQLIIQLIEPVAQEGEWNTAVWLYDHEFQLIVFELSMPISSLNTFIASCQGKLPAPKNNLQVSIFAPSVRGHVRTLELNRGQAKYIDEILPTLMEEFVAQPIEDLHFAHKYIGKDKLLVAAISKCLMEKLQEVMYLIPFGRKVLTFPQALLLEENAFKNGNKVHFLGEKFQIENGYVFAQPKKIETQGGAIAQGENTFEHQYFLNTRLLNLLQGRFLDKNHRQIALPYWKMTFSLFLVITLICGSFLYYQATQYRERTINIEQKAIENFLLLAPSEGKVVNLRRQLEGRIRNSSNKKEETLTLYKILHLIDNARRNMSASGTLQLLSFRDGVFYLEWKANSQETLETLNIGLKQQNLNVFLDQVINNGQYYIASYRIQGIDK